MIRVKRVYEAKESDDGTRILVERLWPRGLKKEEAGIDEWMKDIAPSDELRRWFGHKVERWPEFKQRYIEELPDPKKSQLLEQLIQRAAREDITLVYAARDTEHNSARVLEELVAKRLKS